MADLWIDDLVSFKNWLFAERESSEALKGFFDQVEHIVTEDYGSFKITQETVINIGAHIAEAEKMDDQIHLNETLSRMMVRFKEKAHLKSPISEAAINEVNKAAEEARNASEAKITKLEATHPHFSTSILENFKGSTAKENFGRVTGVSLGGILLAKSFTWDRHQDQEGHKPNPAIKIIDGGAGLALMLLSLFIRPRNVGPQKEIINELRGRLGSLEAAAERGI